MKSNAKAKSVSQSNRDSKNNSGNKGNSGNKTNRKGKSRNKSKRWPLWAAVGGAIVIVLAACAWWYCKQCDVSYQGEEVRIYVPYNITEQSLADTLRLRLGADYADQVMMLWGWGDSDPRRAEGSYVVRKGMTAKQLSDKLRGGIQDPVRVTFNNVRTLQQLSERIARKLELSDVDFLEACDSVLPPRGFVPETYPAAFMPDTYEFYWDASAQDVVRKLADIGDRWWTPERKAKAEALGLDRCQVATLASIVEEETAKADEKPKVARLYLNRLSKGMRLQADPTVKFATGDFTLRRITGKHLEIESPYNTYKHEGLPPGPIRIPEKATLEAVLSAPMHDYLFMCAKEDFSGYHNFAVTGAEHAANARRYHDELNRRNIK